MFILANSKLPIESRLMKIHRLLSALTLAAVVSLASPSASAGTTTSAKAPAPAIEPVDDPLGLKATVGYDMRYYVRGFWFANHNVWTSLAYSTPLTDKLSLDFFTYYVQSWTPADYNEVDAGVYMTYDAGFTKVTFGYTWYYYLNGFFGDGQGPQDWAHEVGFNSITPLGPVNFNFAYYYDLYIAANYFQAGFDTTIPVTDKIAIVPSAVVGYNVGDYYSLGTADTGFNHVGLRIDVPITLTKTATLTPYLAANFSLEGKEGVNTVEGENELWAGVALSVTF
jgi:hypothetical protein